MKKDPNNNEIKIFFFYCLEFKIEKTLQQKKNFKNISFFGNKVNDDDNHMIRMKDRHAYIKL